MVAFPRSGTGLAILIGCVLVGGCAGSTDSGPRPVARASSSATAQRAFRELMAHWDSVSPETSHALEGEIDDFLRRYPNDGQADTARTYLAWLYYERGEIAAARRTLDPALQRQGGATADFATAIEAAFLLERGRKEQAYVRLVDLRGKLIGQQERVLYLGVLIRAAHELGRYVEACELMFEWLEQAPPNRQERMIIAVGGYVRDTPSAALETALKKIQVRRADEPRARREARVFLVERIRRELRREALEQNDVRLARRLLDGGEGSGGESDERLEQLAAGAGFVSRVEGRTLGLVLELGSADGRRRSSEVATGISTTLSLSRRDASEQQVRLAVRDAADDVTTGLTELAGGGAVLLAAGVTPESAELAAEWAESRRVPVLLLEQPPFQPEAPTRRFSFVVGASQEMVGEVLEQHLERTGVAPVAWLEPDAPGCDAASIQPGTNRFPVVRWKKSRVRAVVLLASETCSNAAAAEARRVGLSAPLALGLEATGLAATAPTARWAVETGGFPFSGADNPQDLEEFRASRGRVPGWFESLGHDVALLASEALSRLPISRSDDSQRVAQLQDLARLHLTRGKVAGLWTTEEPGFDRALTLPRSFRVATLCSP